MGRSHTHTHTYLKIQHVQHGSRNFDPENRRTAGGLILVRTSRKLPISVRFSGASSGALLHTPTHTIPISQHIRVLTQPRNRTSLPDVCQLWCTESVRDNPYASVPSLRTRVDTAKSRVQKFANLPHESFTVGFEDTEQLFILVFLIDRSVDCMNAAARAGHDECGDQHPGAAAAATRTERPRR